MQDFRIHKLDEDLKWLRLSRTFFFINSRNVLKDKGIKRIKMQKNRRLNSHEMFVLTLTSHENPTK